MDVKKYIEVTCRNYKELKKLECVKDIQLKSGTELELTIKPECTQGMPIVREGDYLVQFASGSWQRFGSEAFLKLNLLPSKIRGADC